MVKLTYISTSIPVIFRNFLCSYAPKIFHLRSDNPHNITQRSKQSTHITEKVDIVSVSVYCIWNDYLTMGHPIRAQFLRVPPPLKRLNFHFNCQQPCELKLSTSLTASTLISRLETDVDLTLISKWHVSWHPTFKAGFQFSTSCKFIQNTDHPLSVSSDKIVNAIYMFDPNYHG